MVKLDITYINKKSIIFDFIIILKTIGVLFGSKDAY
jgi:lipopolysaccharide/colanic/teichoic acid biosynthesis glycosyltransferase